jgi:hypothetical protein
VSGASRPATRSAIPALQQGTPKMKTTLMTALVMTAMAVPAHAEFYFDCTKPSPASGGAAYYEYCHRHDSDAERLRQQLNGQLNPLDLSGFANAINNMLGQSDGNWVGGGRYVGNGVPASGGNRHHFSGNMHYRPSDSDITGIGPSRGGHSTGGSHVATHEARHFGSPTTGDTNGCRSGWTGTVEDTCMPIGSTSSGSKHCSSDKPYFSADNSACFSTP